MPPLTAAKNLQSLRLVPLSCPLLQIVVVQSYIQDLNWILCIVLHSIYILITLYKGEFLFNIIIHFVFSFTANELKPCFFDFDAHRKVIPLKSSAVCITLLSNRYLPSYFKCSMLEGNWAMACACKLRCASWAWPGCTDKRHLLHLENDNKWIQAASSASCMPRRRSSHLWSL